MVWLYVYLIGAAISMFLVSFAAGVQGDNKKKMEGWAGLIPVATLVWPLFWLIAIGSLFGYIFNKATR